jgi:hypothetical protein
VLPFSWVITISFIDIIGTIDSPVLSAVELELKLFTEIGVSVKTDGVNFSFLSALEVKFQDSIGCDVVRQIDFPKAVAL